MKHQLEVATAPVLIGGKTVPTDMEPVLNPARTTHIVGEVALGGSQEIDTAVQTADRASQHWAAMSPLERAELMIEAADLLDQSVDSRARLLTLEQGKVLWESMADAGAASSLLRYYASLAERLASESVTQERVGTAISRLRPTGVAGVIVPWNYPIKLAFLMISPALLAGNPVVVKPSEFAPLALWRTLEIVASVLPDGVVNVVPGRGEAAGSALASHPLVRKILFTGSTATGSQIMREAADTVKNLSMELGGNDPAIVLESANITDSLIEEMLRGVYTSSGQICFNVKRIYVHRSLHDEFVHRFTDAAGRIVVGDGLDPRSTIGPLNNAKQFDRVTSLVANTSAGGARVEVVGSALDESGWDDGYFMLPTVVTDVAPDAELVITEQFGPIVPILPFSSEPEAVRLANDTEFGLAASVWSEDEDHAANLARQLEAGSVFVNVHRAGASSMSMPFGGVKQSGVGRGHGWAAVEACSELQIVLQNADRGALPGSDISAWRIG